MIHLQPRQDELTRRLIGLENQLRVTVRDPGKFTDCLAKVFREFCNVSPIRTSKELDFFVQLGMLYLGNKLWFDSGQQTVSFLTLSVYDQQQQVLHIKPSFYGRGRCAVAHPTVPVFSSKRVGISGLAAHTNQAVIWAPQGDGVCPYHIGLVRQPTKSGACLPLSNRLLELLQAESPRERGNALNELFPVKPSGEVCCEAAGPNCLCPSKADRSLAAERVLQEFIAPENRRPDLWGVINIECESDSFDQTVVRDWLLTAGDAEFRDVVCRLTLCLQAYRTKRNEYKIIRTVNTTNQLAQHNLRPREAYRALLEEVSSICFGADVTLHFRDTFENDDVNTSRCLRLISGVGANFRSFLIGERYGLSDGLVGHVVDSGKPKILTEAEIRRAVKAFDEGTPSNIPFRSLMPDTRFNIALPISFYKLIIGALNIECDAACLARIGAKGYRVETYFENLRRVLERICSYLAIVIDYFDDLENSLLRRQSGRVETPPAEPDSPSAGDAFSVEYGHRPLLGYYVAKVLSLIDAQSIASEHVRDDKFLQDITDAVGYLLGSETDHRIQFSVRRKIDDQLHMVRDPHGYDRGLKPIDCSPGDSVLASCANLAFPIFGEIKDQTGLEPDPICHQLFPRDWYREMHHAPVAIPEKIPYVTSGATKTLLEYSAPLIFGPNLLGTIDYEIFSHETDAVVKEPDRIHVRSFLEWARAISYCLAYFEDRHDLLPKLADLKYDIEKKHLSDFLRLTSQIIANVHMPIGDVLDIAFRHYGELVPIERVHVVTDKYRHGATDEEFYYPSPERRKADMIAELNARLADGAHKNSPSSHYLPLADRGRFLGGLHVQRKNTETPNRQRPPVFDEPFNREAVRGVLNLMGGHITNIIKGDEYYRDRPDELKALCISLGQGFAERFEKLTVSATTLEEKVFLVGEALHGLLADYHTGPMRTSSSDRLMWLVYHVRPHARFRSALMECGRSLVAGKEWPVRHAGVSLKDKTRLGRLMTDEKQKLLGEITLQPATCNGKADAFNTAALTRLKAAGADNLEGVADVAMEGLAHKVYALEDNRRSITRRSATKKRIQSFPNFNSSPYRSDRSPRKWFFDVPYSMLSMPIVVRKTSHDDTKPYDACIGVLNLFRRRDTVNDFLFFNTEEMVSVKRLQDHLANELAKHFRVDGISIAEARTAYVAAGGENSPVAHVLSLPSVGKIAEGLNKSSGTNHVVNCNFTHKKDAVEALARSSDGWQVFFVEEILDPKNRGKFDPATRVALLFDKPGVFVDTSQRPALLEIFAAFRPGPGRQAKQFILFGNENTVAEIERLIIGVNFERLDQYGEKNGTAPGDDAARMLGIGIALCRQKEGRAPAEAVYLLRSRSKPKPLEDFFGSCAPQLHEIEEVARHVLDDCPIGHDAYLL